MSITKLLSLAEFVTDIQDYVTESNNPERAYKLIVAYKDFLNTPITEEMFTGKEPLFDGFVKCHPSAATTDPYNRIVKSFDNFGKEKFSITILKQAGVDFISVKEVSGYKLDDKNMKKLSFHTYFHLKTINDLVGKIDNYQYHEGNEWAWQENI